jgi:excisionase family DNA binding protein
METHIQASQQARQAGVSRRDFVYHPRFSPKLLRKNEIGDSLMSESSLFDNFIWLNTEEAAEYLRTSPKQVRKWVYQGKIQPYKLFGKSLRFKKSDLELLFKGGPRWE